MERHALCHCPCSLTDKGTMEAGAMLRQEHRPIAGRTGSQNWALILYIGPWSLEATFSLPEASLPRDALFILVTHSAEHQGRSRGLSCLCTGALSFVNYETGFPGHRQHSSSQALKGSGKSLAFSTQARPCLE